MESTKKCWANNRIAELRGPIDDDFIHTQTKKKQRQYLLLHNCPNFIKDTNGWLTYRMEERQLQRIHMHNQWNGEKDHECFSTDKASQVTKFGSLLSKGEHKKDVTQYLFQSVLGRA